MPGRVLMISYYFPPRPGMASQRILGLAKYLPGHGWEPVVVTPHYPGKKPSGIRMVQTEDPGILSHRFKRLLGLDPGILIKNRIEGDDEKRNPLRKFLGRLFSGFREIALFPDEEVLWAPIAAREGLRLLSTDGGFDALLSSAGPVSLCLAARYLKRKTGLPWVADLRDLWSQNPYFEFNVIRRVMDRELERWTLREADVLVTTSRPWAETLSRLHPEKRVEVITNGFDPDDAVEAGRPQILTRDFTITYTGMLYQGKRDPSLLFRALRELFQDGKMDRNRVKVRFYGPREEFLEHRIEEHGLQGVAEHLGEVSRQESLGRQRESQLLLLLSWNDPRDYGTYTGKVFEYLAARRPILAVGGPGGVVRELLDHTKAGVHCNELEDLKEKLLNFYREYLETGQVSYPGDWGRVEEFSHREMAGRFARILDSLVSKTEAV